jgi:hypothetical protein|uniref:Chitosanase n=1 Tax=Myoviridae sp. ctYA416 TaxID=2825125 RepID=A0A8S5UTI0_9CAUD|nr:MAG TPA: chitosanase [Myoviridae sp. ctYA416]
MIGELSAKYESNGGPGTISDGYGDPGGKSYGTYQLSSNAGSLEEFVEWLIDNGYWFGNELNKYYLTSPEFDSAWEWLANSANAQDFADAQHKYAIYAYYDPAVRSLRTAGFNIENHNDVMKDVVFSRSIQYGPGLIVEMFEEAVGYMGYPNLSYIDDAKFDYDLIVSVYLKVCSSLEWNNSAVREGVNARFRSECQDALDRL